MTSIPSPDQPSSTAHAAPTGTTARPPLRRSSSDRMLAGVCGGLAEYSGLDPVLWRVGMVALTLLGPGLVVYLLLWVAMPTGPGHTPGPLDPMIERVREALSGARSR